MASSRIDLAIHGVLVNVGGTGILLTGKPGIGKSECALELITRGHKLIADDVIEIAAIDNNLVGRAPERFQGLLDVRDLGIIDVRQVFGVEAVGLNHRIDLSIELLGEQNADRDRIGGSPRWQEFEQVKIPNYVINSSQNRNIPLMVETAARRFRCKVRSAEKSLILSHDMLVSSAVTDDVSP